MLQRTRTSRERGSRRDCQGREENEDDDDTDEDESFKGTSNGAQTTPAPRPRRLIIDTSLLAPEPHLDPIGVSTPLGTSEVIFGIGTFPH